ncbi:thioredoxin family protein [Alteribacter natronophilus]|uniref:thioredoxin family protein n=1 Tax=Alteribacter natronophilus TaxID=2583810 RepID=UPI00110E6FA4|nr:thioredoxin family protein [Alteribacter natronophilus]TMW71549.1 thioredoxin family protein [Alteribacter natronophilus]
MKKIIIFGVVLLVIFAALAFVTTQQNQQQSEGNPYGKDRLHPETIDTLDNPLYENIILPDEVDEMKDNGEDFTVYYFSPACPVCNEVTPYLVPAAEDEGVDLHMLNLLEYDNEMFDYYDIEGTPTVIHYENGVEEARVAGGADEKTYRQFFNEVVLDQQ